MARLANLSSWRPVMKQVDVPPTEFQHRSSHKKGFPQGFMTCQEVNQSCQRTILLGLQWLCLFSLLLWHIMNAWSRWYRRCCEPSSTKEVFEAVSNLPACPGLLVCVVIPLVYAWLGKLFSQTRAWVPNQNPQQEKGPTQDANRGGSASIRDLQLPIISLCSAGSPVFLHC